MKKRSFSLVQSWGSLALVHSNLERVDVAKDNVVVEITAATICEADRRFVSGSKRVEGNSPCTTLGHEAVGKIIAVGSNVKHLKMGQMVVIMPHQVPETERKKIAFSKGEIFKLHTHHCGMHCDGTIANHIEWPAEWVRPIPKTAMRNAMKASLVHGLHWTLPLAEIEHLACVMTSLTQFEVADRVWAGNANVNRLKSGKARVLMIGAGWMGFLYMMHLHAKYPKATVAIKDPDEQRLRMFGDLSESVLGHRPEIAYSLDPSAERSFDVVIMATAARAAAMDLFRYLKPGGHVVLFSGIHNGAIDLVFDPAKLSDLERVHRDGIHAMVYRTPEADRHDMVVASGTSGYTVRAFEAATRGIGEYAAGIGTGITGVVLGMESKEMIAVRRSATPLVSADGQPILKTLFEPNWPGRQNHLKIGIHPNPTSEIRSSYEEFIGQGARS
jgi:threonine dehydrogenase-like Zn-dependent dehydrogenase